MRFHLLSLPNVQTTKEYDLDGFCTMTIRFAKLLKGLGHQVYLYASEENEAPCDELVTVITKREIANFFATQNNQQYQQVFISDTAPLWQLSNPRIADEIRKRKQPHDFIATIGGGSQYAVAQAHMDLMPIEYSIGYVGQFSRYRVFQSRAWQHASYGMQHVDEVRPYDTVIPGFFNEDEFEYVPDHGDYLVYVGRFIPKKGISVACQMSAATGLPVKFVGHGNHQFVVDQMQKYGAKGEIHIGVHDDKRNELMAHARALVCPTFYVEPYGCISPEAQMCGTPVISTDAGGFTETVQHGLTGFRCNILGEFVDAVEKVRGLNRRYIRDRAVRTYSIAAAASQYQAYFNRLATLWGKGWDTTPYPLEFQHAVERSDAEVQQGQPAFGLEVGAEGGVAGSGDRDHDVREGTSESREVGVRG